MTHRWGSVDLDRLPVRYFQVPRSIDAVVEDLMNPVPRNREWSAIGLVCSGVDFIVRSGNGVAADDHTECHTHSAEIPAVIAGRAVENRCSDRWVDGSAQVQLCHEGSAEASVRG